MSHFAYAEIAIEIYTVDTYKYKAVYTSNADRLIINYFRKKIAEWDLKYKYVGVEIFMDGAKIKDTFTEND